jgi:hypothetical protein
MSGAKPSKRLLSPTRILRRPPPRLFRVLTVAFAIVSLLLICLWRQQHRLPAHDEDGLEPFPIVHGQLANHVEKLYPLQPFPESPMEHVKAQPTNNPMLLAVICSAASTERRMLIRSTWMQMYSHLPVDMRFVVSNPGPQWTNVVIYENRTYGDMIVLDHLQEDDVTANTVKTLQFYKWLLQQERKYEYVAKTDTDVWVNLAGFWDRFISPRLASENGTLVATVDRTVIADLAYRPSGDLVYPLGSMYTVTWDMVVLLVSLQSRFNIITGEDMAVGVLMRKGRQRANFVNFRGTEKFNFDPKDARQRDSPWARTRTHPYSGWHAMYGDQVIAVHELKKEEVFQSVGGCFNEHGVNPMPAPLDPEPMNSWESQWHDVWSLFGMSTRNKSRFQLIPEYKWELDADSGDWICDGVWNTGPSKTGYNQESGR